MPDESHPWGWDLEVASGGYYYRKASPARVGYGDRQY